MENLDNKILFLIVLAAIVASFVMNESPKKRAVAKQSTSLNVNISEQNLLSKSKNPTKPSFDGNKTRQSLDISIVEMPSAVKNTDKTAFKQGKAGKDAGGLGAGGVNFNTGIKSVNSSGNLAGTAAFNGGASADFNATKPRQPLNFSFSNLGGKLQMNLKSATLNEQINAHLKGQNINPQSPVGRDFSGVQDLIKLFGDKANLDLNLSQNSANSLQKIANLSENSRKILGLDGLGLKRLEKPKKSGENEASGLDKNGEINKNADDDAPSVNADKSLNYNALQAILREFGVDLNDFNLSAQSAESPSFAEKNLIDITTTSLLDANQSLQKLVQIELYDEPRLLRRDFVMKRPPKNFPAKLFDKDTGGKKLWQGKETWELWRENKAKSRSVWTLVSGTFYLYKGESGGKKGDERSGERGYLSDELALSLQKDRQNRHFIAIITPESFEKKQVFDYASVGEHHIFALGEQNFMVARLFNRDFTQWWSCKLTQASFRCNKISANSGEIAFSSDTNSYEMRLSRVGDSVNYK